MNVLCWDGENRIVHPLLFSVIADHQEACMVSSTYAARRAKRPCASCTTERESTQFTSMVGYDDLPWRTEETQKQRIEQMRGGDQQIGKQYSQHAIEVCVKQQMLRRNMRSESLAQVFFASLCYAALFPWLEAWFPSRLPTRTRSLHGIDGGAYASNGFGDLLAHQEDPVSKVYPAEAEWPVPARNGATG